MVFILLSVPPTCFDATLHFDYKASKHAKNDEDVLSRYTRGEY